LAGFNEATAGSAACSNSGIRRFCEDFDELHVMAGGLLKDGAQGLLGD